MKSLREYTRVIVETEEENPTTIAEITSEEVKIADGYRVRLIPVYDQPLGGNGSLP